MGSNPGLPHGRVQPWESYTRVPLLSSIITGSCSWDGLVSHCLAIQALMILHLQTQGLGEGDEHPPMLSNGVWRTSPFLVCNTMKSYAVCSVLVSLMFCAH